MTQNKIHLLIGLCRPMLPFTVCQFCYLLPHMFAYIFTPYIQYENSSLPSVHKDLNETMSIPAENNADTLYIKA